MLSYRHAFHAGNHADVLKHLVLLQCLAQLNRKETPYWVVDTHAGAGIYPLQSAVGEKLAEWRDGIARLWEASADDLPEPLLDYRQRVARLNTDGQLHNYPGSPWFAWSLSRDGDSLRLFERHPADAQTLRGNLDGAGGRVRVAESDGFAGLKALLPPPPRRGLVLIDPSYETRGDYDAVPLALAEGLKRFATGIDAIWYPRLSRRDARPVPERLKDVSAARPWLDVTLDVTRPAADGHGLFGSGMFVVNPPWTLRTALDASLPWLAEHLGERGVYSVTESQPTT